jgi:hypothetical protein
MGATGDLHRALLRSSIDDAAIVRAQAQLSAVPVEPLLHHLAHANLGAARAAATGALRRGEVRVFDALLGIPRASRVALPIAMASGPTIRPWLASIIDDDPVQALIGLGLLGDPEALGLLLEHVHVQGHSTVAALGLFLITGAVLEVPSPVEEEIALDDSAEVPSSADQVVLAGSGISTDPALWASWLRANRIRFQPGVRYRLGQVASPLTELAVLSGTGLPLWLRKCLADEFAIRYAITWTYQPDMLVVRQRELVAWMTRRLEDARPRFTDGTWYFQGRVVQ